MTKTLYDLLGALPEDEAEGLRTAFRQAVKGVHPDLNPGDPDAALKFRRLVRANDILLDEDQRAAYDHLLDVAGLEQETASKRAIAGKIYRVASGTLAFATVSVAVLGGYLLFVHISMASVAPRGAVQTAHASSGIAALASAMPRMVSGRNAQPLNDERTGDAGSAPAADASRSAVLQATSIDPGDAIADAELGPIFSPAYVDRKIVFYWPRKSGFAAAHRAKAADKASHARPAPHAIRTPRIALRVQPFFRQSASNDLSRQEGFAFTR